jgi:hypothetical protein
LAPLYLTTKHCGNLINREDDSQWPTKNVVGSQEIEVRLGNEHVSFEVRKEDVTVTRRETKHYYNRPPS